MEGGQWVRVCPTFGGDDPYYGEGFIKMNSILEKKGWNKLLNDLVKL
jgi:hypothetical protein